jgi:hypothetical protein
VCPFVVYALLPWDGVFASALAMAAGSPRRIAVAAVATAWANATRSALPWLFTTTAVNPTMQAPL